MMDQAIPLIWATIQAWFSPTLFFVLLNIVIGTIVYTAKGAISPAEGVAAAHKLARSPSAVFDRLRSFKLYRNPSSLEPQPAIITQTLDSHDHVPLIASQEPIHFIRSQSDAQPTAGELPPKLAAKLKKSASTKSVFAHFEEDDIVSAAAEVEVDEDEDDEEEEEEVDAKADDFINRFRQQLKLQRLDSILRYKEMLNRGN